MADIEAVREAAVREYNEKFGENGSPKEDTHWVEMCTVMKERLMPKHNEDQERAELIRQLHIRLAEERNPVCSSLLLCRTMCICYITECHHGNNADG